MCILVCLATAAQVTRVADGAKMEVHEGRRVEFNWCFRIQNPSVVP